MNGKREGDMLYILRQTILEASWERQLAEILELAKDVLIEEVMFMEQSHQIVMVPFSIEKHRVMSGIYKIMGQRLKEVGIDYSVNIATIVGHADAPVPQEMVLPYQKFVGEDLIERHAIYCIGDEDWQDYAQEVVKLYAETHPKRIMIDDDFRSLNHTAQFGCFCDLHLKALKVELQVQDDFSAEDLLDSLLGHSSDELEVKQAWQKVNFEFQLSAARKIEAAIHSVDPMVEIGLMNSGEEAHSLQGRDMSVLLQAFAGEGRKALSRPAGGVYADGVHNQIINMHQTPALSYHASKVETTWVSEVENWPHSRYIKSLAITRLQLLMHVLFGADALTLNLYDYLATPHSLESGWGDMLKNMKPQLKMLQELRKGKNLKGISLPWKAEYASLKYNRMHRLQDLFPQRPLDLLLPQMGIPTQFEPSNINILLGDEILAYSAQELEVYLSKGLLIDNRAAKHLIAMGFEQDLGIRFSEQLKVPCVERLSDLQFSGDYHQCDLPTNWFRTELQGDTIDVMELTSNAKAIAHFVDQDNRLISPSLVLFENERGGRIAIMAQTVQELAFLHRGKSIQMQAIFKWMNPTFETFFIHDTPNVAPFVYEDTTSGLFILVNAGLDEEHVEVPAHFQHVFGTDTKSKTLKPLAFEVYAYAIEQD